MIRSPHRSCFLEFDRSVLFRTEYFLKLLSSALFTVRNVVMARLCFHSCLRFCSQGGCVADTPQADTPLGQTLPLGRLSPGINHFPADTPWADTPRHPPRHLPGRHHPAQRIAGIHYPLPSACWDTPPNPQRPLQADGTHPAGMHSC